MNGAGAPTGDGGRKPFHLQSAGDQSNGLRAQRSGRHQQHRIRSFRSGDLKDGRDG
jgi:hypothetical protein